MKYSIDIPLSAILRFFENRKERKRREEMQKRRQKRKRIEAEIDQKLAEYFHEFDNEEK